MKTYNFEINITLTDIGIDAENEDKARAKLTERVSEYFAATEISITEQEAKLMRVSEA